MSFLRKKNISSKEKKSEGNGLKSIKKSYFKNNTCKVTFSLPKDAAPNAKKVYLVGQFNDWNQKKTPMKKLKTGDFSLPLTLKQGEEYEYRYLIDNAKWENDWCADKYIPNLYGENNSVVVV